MGERLSNRTKELEPGEIHPNETNKNPLEEKTSAKNWENLWLTYHPKKDCGNKAYAKHIIVNGFDREQAIVYNALKELSQGIRGMLGVEPEMIGVEPEVKAEIESKTGIRMIRATSRKSDESIGKEGYRLWEKDGLLTLEAEDEKGLLYGVFHILRQIAVQKPLEKLTVLCRPDNPLRMYNHWDNLDGSIERGYSGQSFFFHDNQVLVNERTVDYARLAASIGINGVVINNVNVNDAATWLITPRYFEKVAQIARIFEGFGIRLFLSLNFAASIELGGPDSSDPLDEQVISWWREKMAQIFSAIPNLGGFLVKADSEGRPGPFTYGRTQADGANMLARVVEPYGAIIIWRCFVYNCTQDWRDRITDRARAGYDNFIDTDGDYLDNVILQIKNGPMDFQIREPVSPLLGGLKRTNQILEVQIAQEYTGHQIDVCYLIPMFREVLDFRTCCTSLAKGDAPDKVADIISGRTFGNQHCGMAAVCNTGNDENWTGNDLAAANFYGFGRLAWSVSLTAEEIAEEWICMTLSCDEKVVDTVKKILLGSRETYEKYTSPLGIGWMVTPHTHYGPSVDGYEYSRWGTYHRADCKGIGVDRTTRGTGYVSQYHEANASMYQNIRTCPEELLLFFHHIPYTHVLKNGKTLIQHIYDTHFEGVEEVEAMIDAWEQLRGKVPDKTYAVVAERFERQLWNAKEWRDQVNSYFYRKSGIGDREKRDIY